MNLIWNYLKVIRILVLTIVLMTHVIFAEDQYINVEPLSYSEITQQKIDAARERIMDKYHVTKFENMTDDAIRELHVIINEIKDEDPELISLKEGESSLYSNVVRMGQIFVTGDPSKEIGSWEFEHGHAGIGDITQNQVIEANPGKGVRIEKDRVTGYWSIRNASIMKVRNAIDGDYKKAYEFANSKVYSPYKNPVTGYPFDGYYCSELVFLAWKNAGFNINGWGAGVIYPQAIYEDADTYAVKSYGDGY